MVLRVVIGFFLFVNSFAQASEQTSLLKSCEAITDFCEKIFCAPNFSVVYTSAKHVLPFYIQQTESLHPQVKEELKKLEVFQQEPLDFSKRLLTNTEVLDLQNKRSARLLEIERLKLVKKNLADDHNSEQINQSLDKTIQNYQDSIQEIELKLGQHEKDWIAEINRQNEINALHQQIADLRKTDQVFDDIRPLRKFILLLEEARLSQTEIDKWILIAKSKGYDAAIAMLRSRNRDRL